jgi:hypothetical protein
MGGNKPGRVGIGNKIMSTEHLHLNTSPTKNNNKLPTGRRQGAWMPRANT